MLVINSIKSKYLYTRVYVCVYTGICVHLCDSICPGAHCHWRGQTGKQVTYLKTPRIFHRSGGTIGKMSVLSSSVGIEKRKGCGIKTSEKVVRGS